MVSEPWPRGQKMNPQINIGDCNKCIRTRATSRSARSAKDIMHFFFIFLAKPLCLGPGIVHALLVLVKELLVKDVGVLLEGFLLTFHLGLLVPGLHLHSTILDDLIDARHGLVSVNAPGRNNSGQGEHALIPCSALEHVPRLELEYTVVAVSVNLQACDTLVCHKMKLVVQLDDLFDFFVLDRNEVVVRVAQVEEIVDVIVRQLGKGGWGWGDGGRSCDRGSGRGRGLLLVLTGARLGRRGPLTEEVELDT